MKLDVGPPCWLEPDPRQFVPAAIHQRYGFELPDIPSMRLEEVVAEKVARLTRLLTARDASDLVWAATTSPHSRFSPDRVRRLAVLKVWVDNHGLRPAWSPALSPTPFNPETWLSSRDGWDDEQIGLLTRAPPELGVLEAQLIEYYAWLRDFVDDEMRWAAVDARHRGEIIKAIQRLEYSALVGVHLW